MAVCNTHGDGQEEKDNNGNLKKRVEGAEVHNTGVAPIALTIVASHTLSLSTADVDVVTA